MENGRILVDTSLVIEYLRSQNRPKSSFIKLFRTNELCLSAISIFELLIEFRDILIGATAILYNIPIATLNIKHFERIDNLQFHKL